MLYSWRSKALMKYGHGWLIASAESAEEAKELIRLEFRNWLLENRHYLLTEGLPSDEESANEIEAIRLVLEEDLKVEPDIRSVILINGSE